MRNPAKTNYGRKILFNEILSKNLANNKFKIDAFYESTVHNRISSILISNDQTVHLGTNISFGKEKMFSDCSEPMELSIAFRAYFIINYLHCLESAKKSVPTSFFSGLVILDSISDLYCTKKRIVYEPNAVGANKNLRPIEVYCAIRAATRVLIEYRSFLSDNAVKQCESYIDTLIEYTKMPEVEYINSRCAQYTILHKRDILMSLVKRCPEITSECEIFRQVKFNSLDDLNIDYVLSVCDTNENSFWPEAILKILSFTKDRNVGSLCHKHPSMRNSYLEFCAKSVECFFEKKEHSTLLKDNWLAVRQLVRGIEQSIIYNADHINGMVHYIR